MTNSSEPRVSVIIPTTGRPELPRAIESARRQTGAFNVEVVVVYDGDDPHVADRIRLHADQVLVTGGGRGGSAARNLGVDSSTGQYIAFLDDDDEWLPPKLEVQLALLREQADPDRCVVSSRHVHVDASTGKSSGAAPTRTLLGDRPVDEFLFRRRAPHGGRASLYTSTLLCSRNLARQNRWNSSLKRHQDWDWLIAAERRHGATVVQAPAALVKIQTGSSGSISARSDWLSSLEWAEAVLTEPAIRADFLTAQTLRYALQARSLDGCAKVLRAISTTKRLPALGPSIIGVAGLLPRRSIERIASSTTARPQ